MRFTFLLIISSLIFSFSVQAQNNKELDELSKKLLPVIVLSLKQNKNASEAQELNEFYRGLITEVLEDDINRLSQALRLIFMDNFGR